MVGSRVYVGGLPYGCRERDLERFFKGYGRIRDVLLKNGYGFVEFEDYRDADDAVYEMNGKELLGERWGCRGDFFDWFNFNLMFVFRFSGLLLKQPVGRHGAVTAEEIDMTDMIDVVAGKRVCF